MIKKRAKKYTCKRCKTIKFDNNIKFHEYIRTRHVKKSKTIVSFFAQISESKFVSKQSIFLFSVSSSRSMIFSFFSSFFISSKLLFLAISTSEIVRERSENVSFISSIETSKKSISWAEITSRSIIASKFSRFPIATFKSMCKFSKNANVVCSSISFRIFSSKHQNIQKLYLIVNDLIRMFVEKSNSFDLQRHQMRSFSFRDFDKCNFANKCDFIQSRITLYFNAMIIFAFKSIKFEAFESTHARENLSRQFSIFSRSISFVFFSFRFVSMRFSFSKIFRSVSVCKHCQKRFVIYRFIDWIMSNVSKVENNKIFMKMRYWRFVSFHSTLKKYWLFLEKVITLRKLKHVVCLLFVRSFFSVNRWSIWRN